ncbi:MAG: helix-turn-helix domain-containing protein [bacterium]
MNTKRNFTIELGKRLRAVRSSQKISIEDLANQSDMTYSQISRIELGKINTTVYTLYKLSKSLNVHPMEILPLITHN